MDIPIPYLQPPATLVNQAIDVLGEPGKIIGDITDGTPVAEAARRNYGQSLRQLLRAAHWGFARKQAPLTLLGDATGNSSLPVIAQVDTPWSYAYAWPIDACQGRWMPWSPTNVQPQNAQGVPLTTGVSTGVPYALMPGRFLVSSSNLYPIEIGNTPWTQQPDLQRTEGLGPINRKIILTDCANALFVYTRLVTVIEEFDDGFRNAFVTMLALVLAPAVIEDPKLRLAEVQRLVPMLKNAVDNARLQSANEAGYPQSTDFQASWLRARNQRGCNGWGDGAGIMGIDGMGAGYGCGFESFSLVGSVF